MHLMSELPEKPARGITPCQAGHGRSKDRADNANQYEHREGVLRHALEGAQSEHGEPPCRGDAMPHGRGGVVKGGGVMRYVLCFWTATPVYVICLRGGKDIVVAPAKGWTCLGDQAVSGAWLLTR